MFGLCWLIDFANIGRVIIDIYKSSNIIFSMERMNEYKRIKIITNSGFKYSGGKKSQDSCFVTIIDDKQGEIQIPLANISFMKEVGYDNF